MQNYKIKVNNEAESKEAQELLFELGAVWGQSKTATLNLEPMSFIYFNGSSIYYGHDDENDDYWFQVEESGKEITLQQLRDLVAKSKPTEQDLISGADAKLAWAKGEDVQISHKHATLKKEWHDLYGTLMLSAFDSDMYEFRIKPRTIKLELEIPAPFEPKDGDEFWILFESHYSPCGYKLVLPGDQYSELCYGAWRTEEEIKQVVAALHGALKNG